MSEETILDSADGCASAAELRRALDAAARRPPGPAIVELRLTGLVDPRAAERLASIAAAYGFRVQRP